MISKLSTSHIPQLLYLPESGMGYQFIQAETDFYGTKKNFLVLNSQFLFEDTSKIREEVKSFFNTNCRAENYINSEELRKIKLIDNLSNSNFHSLSFQKNKGAIHNREEYANGIDVFFRLSAFENDFRIDTENKCLIAGSYTTTEEDYQLCKLFNFDPVDRYAMPNDDKIEWVFKIKPLNCDPLQKGIVEPAFNHKGGGAEVFFVKGTSRNTYIEKKSY